MIEVGNIHARREEKTLRTILDRIGGQTNDGKTEIVTGPNRDVLKGFYRSLLCEELTPGRICTLMHQMYWISVWAGHRPFAEMSRNDVIELMNGIRSRKIARGPAGRMFSPRTLEGYKTTLKKFWRWLKNPDLMPRQLAEAPYPPEVSWIKRKRNKGAVLPKDIWTPEEVSRMAAMAYSTKDRAFVLGLFGSGCRIGEFLDLKRRDVVFDECGCQILVDGKTGSRRVRLTASASQALATWLDFHPNKNPGSPVWLNTETNDDIPARQLSYDWAYGMLGRLARKAGIRKPIRPHLLRHSLATYYASKLTEAVMNEHFGWRQGSRTAAIYTHLSGRQVDDQLLAVCGRERQDDGSQRALGTIRCPRCTMENAAWSSRCATCGLPLEDVPMELARRRATADQLMDLLMQDAEVWDALQRALNPLITPTTDLSHPDGASLMPQSGPQWGDSSGEDTLVTAASPNEPGVLLDLPGGAQAVYWHDLQATGERSPNQTNHKTEDGAP